MYEFLGKNRSTSSHKADYEVCLPSDTVFGFHEQHRLVEQLHSVFEEGTFALLEEKLPLIHTRSATISCKQLKFTEYKQQKDQSNVTKCPKVIFIWTLKQYLYRSRLHTNQLPQIQKDRDRVFIFQNLRSSKLNNKQAQN